jgi:hypothetical protein
MEAGADDINGAQRIATVAICPATILPDGRRAIRPDVIAAHMEKLKACFSAAMDAAYEFVDKFWKTIVAVANALIIHRELSAEQVAAIMRDQQSAATPA